MIKNENNLKKSEKKSDWMILLGLLGLTAAFFIPLLVGWERFFFDDIAFIFYPQQVFLARSLADGVMPWWNPYLCAGASTFYAHIFQSTLSPLNWPFLILGNLAPGHNYLWLIKAPLVFYYLLSAIFSYLFSRRGLRLTQAGSFIFALAYAFNPAMIYFSTAPPEVSIQAWLPLFCLCLISFSRNGRLGWLVLGAIAFAIASPAGDVPVVSHVVFITALFGVGILIDAIVKKDGRKAGRVIIGGIVIFGVGLLLAGVYWSNMIEGLRMLGSGATEVVEELSGLPQSLHPLYLVTLFIPDFFGGVTSHHAWGAAYHIRLSLNDVNLLGGLLSFFLVFLGLLVVIKRNRDDDETVAAYIRFWWIFFGVFFFGLVIVLGVYTPLYRLFRAIIPILKMPYPVRFRSIECFAMAGLMGVSVSLLARLVPRNRIWKLAGYLIAVLLFSALALIWSYRDGGVSFSPGWRHLSSLGDWGWFCRGPLLYLAVAGLFLILIAAIKRGKYFFPLMVAGVAAEILLFAYPAFYHNRILNHRYNDSFAVRYRGPRDSPVYQKLLSWNPEGSFDSRRYRRLHYRSYFDNLAWLNGSLNMLGFDIKPLDQRFQGIIEELTEGFPYDVLVRRWDSRFWPNMSVRYLFSRDKLRLPAAREAKMVGECHTYELTDALPRFHFQDHWIVGSEAEEKEALINLDLRESGYCGREAWEARPDPDSYPVLSKVSEERGIERFIKLQEDNQLIGMDLSNPNRIELQVNVSVPSMLIITDLWAVGWSATVDGVAASIQRVNYLQRGIWCSAGTHNIIMEFSPPSLPRGFLMTGAGIICLIILIMIRRKRYKIIKNVL